MGKHSELKGQKGIEKLMNIFNTIPDKKQQQFNDSFFKHLENMQQFMVNSVALPKNILNPNNKISGLNKE